MLRYQFGVAYKQAETYTEVLVAAGLRAALKQINYQRLAVIVSDFITAQGMSIKHLQRNNPPPAQDEVE